MLKIVFKIVTDYGASLPLITSSSTYLDRSIEGKSFAHSDTWRTWWPSDIYVRYLPCHIVLEHAVIRDDDPQLRNISADLATSARN